MSYLVQEKSESSGAPIELYRFSSDGFLDPYLYTNHGDDVTYNFETYTAIPMSRSQPEHSQEVAHRELSIEMPRDNPLAARWISFVPPKTVWLTIYRFHEGDSEVVVFWQGKVRGVAWNGNLATLSCQPTDSVFNRMGLRSTYGASCSHILYDDGCKISNVLYKIATALVTVNGITLTAPAFATFPDTTPVPNGWWVTGYIERPLNGDLRYITAHTGDTITILVGFEGLLAGEVINIYAGCNHTFSTCDIKFNNTDNFGGFPFVPAKNPFEHRIDM